MQPVLAGNSVHIDYQFLRRCIFDALSFRIVDISSFNEISRRWVPSKLNKLPEKAQKHRAMDDILERIAELRLHQEHVFGIPPHKAHWKESYRLCEDGRYGKVLP
jgi:oligoribonuclease